MFSFAYPGLLLLLLIIPALAVLFFVFRAIRKNRLKRFGNPAVLSSLMPGISKYKANLRLVVCLFALAGIIFALARPWGGIKNEETTKEGIEIVIAVDASNSMLASATGDENGPDRMRTAKIILEKLINRLSNDRVGLIAFAGNAYTLIPVTNDYVTAKAFLNSIDPSLFQNQGTDISNAVRLAEKSYSDNPDVGKALILLTDAEELESNDQVIEEVANAAKIGIQTDVIGIGSTPVTIPSKTKGRMVDSQTGDVIRTALNEDLALQIAQAGKGIYVNASNNDAVDELAKQLGKLKKAAMEASFLVTHEELYYPFVIFALVLIILDFFMSDKKNRWLDKINFFRKGSAAAVALIFLTVAVSACKSEKEDNQPAPPSDDINKDSLAMVTSVPEEFDLINFGNDRFHAQDFVSADTSFNAAIGINPKSIVAHLNDGVALLHTIIEKESQTGEGQLPDSIMGPLLQSATSHLQFAASPKIEKGNVSSLAFYNLGNVDFTQKNFQSAIDNYKEALRLNPKDNNARKNLRIAQLQKNDNDQNQQQQQQQQQQQNQDQQPQQNQNQQQQQQQQQNRDQLNEQTIEQILQAAENAENQARIRYNMKKGQSEESNNPNRKNW